MNLQVKRLDWRLNQISILVLVDVGRVTVLVLLEFKADGLVVNFMVSFQLTDLATGVVVARAVLVVLVPAAVSVIAVVAVVAVASASLVVVARSGTNFLGT